MVFLMAIAAKGERDTGLSFNDPLTKKATNALENLPLSTIPNSLIYRYEDFTCSKIADGFYGEIFKVEHRKTGEIMVLKMNKPDLEIDCCTMIHEITLMSDLSHPNVIRFRGVCIADSKMHLLCEYINGGELEGLLLDYTMHLEWWTRLYLAKDIAEGMRYLHKQGVIHRDLTSKNCLIKERNGWRYGIVADLGLATEIQEQSIVGSPYNMAPELLRGEAYDEKADVFSYGIILCEIIGRVPADPDELPRTQKFGLDIEKFQHMAGDCPKEFLQTALCCCQMEPATRPTFAETSKHLEFILVGYKVRPEIEDAMKAPAPSSAEQHAHSPSNEIKHKNEPEKSGAEINSRLSPPSNPPAIVISADASPPLNFRSAEKRRQSWIAGRYKLFNMATDDLLKNTPGKLKSFFHRALHIQTHFDPSKQKKVKDSGKQRSASQLKRYSLINSDENGSLVSGEKYELSSSGSSNPSSVPNSPGGRFLHTEQSMMSSGSSNPSSSPNSPGGTFLHTEQSMQMSNCSLDEVVVDGRCSPQNTHSYTDFLPVSNSHEQPSAPIMLEVTQSCPSSQSPSVCGSPMIRCLETNRPRCQSTPVFNDLNSETSRRTASHRDCEMNNAHSTPEAHIKEDVKLKNRKSPFRIFKRKGSKSKESE